MKYRYNLINQQGVQEAWSGIFNSKKLALEWFEKHGEFHKSRGHNLILTKVRSNEANC
jgi:hypothetical protein